MRSARCDVVARSAPAPRSVKTRTAFGFCCSLAHCERRAVRRRPPLAFFRLARRVRLERAIDGAGIAIENVARRDRRDRSRSHRRFDLRVEDQIAVAVCPAYAAHPAGVAQYFPSRVRGLAPCFNEHRDRIVVAMECRRMERRVAATRRPPPSPGRPPC